MTEYKQDFNTREQDPRIMIRAAMFYYQQLDSHLKNTTHLSQETIKFYVDRLLEITLYLEDLANQIYEGLSDEERAILELAEKKRNENLYIKTDGSKDERAIEHIRSVIEASTKRYNEIREEAKSKLSQDSEI